TGSRGAILLGIPAALLFFLSRQKLSWPSRGKLLALLLLIGAALAVMVTLWWHRFANIGTMFARMDGWSVSLNLWFDHVLFGVGPDGFWWSFPAKMWLSSDADP